jgi:hypothetical protein
LSRRIGFPPIGESWRNTNVQLPEKFQGGRNIFSGEQVCRTDSGLRLATVFARLPFAALFSG